MERVPEMTERIVMRSRPPGPSLLRQTWGDQLFLHWRTRVEVLRPLIPAPLAIDTHEGGAWVGITPVTVIDSHPSFVPPLPWVSGFDQVNVQTYVHLDGVPGVWFFSLDVGSPVAAMAGRTFFRLPFHDADVCHELDGKRVHVRSRRGPDAPAAAFSATWTPDADVFEADPGTVEFFWVERYCLYTAEEGRLYRARLHHEPWPLRRVPLANYDTSLLEANRLAITGDRSRARLVAGGPVEAEIWPLEDLGRL
jgi:uncharacterized protein YqjF (DUF2071 family)